MYDKEVFSSIRFQKEKARKHLDKWEDKKEPLLRDYLLRVGPVGPNQNHSMSFTNIPTPSKKSLGIKGVWWCEPTIFLIVPPLFLKLHIHVVCLISIEQLESS